MRGRRRAGTLLAMALMVGLVAAPVPVGSQPDGETEDVHAFGDATFHGSMADVALAQPIVDIEPTPTGDGYWLTAADGGVFAFGDASFHGSTGAIRLNQPVVGIAATPTGDGYWLTAADGGVFAFGDAGFHGSAVLSSRHRPVTGIAATPSGDGYWLAATGRCAFTGSTTDARFLPESNVMLLTEIRTGTDGCRERIVFQLVDEGGAPDGTISYEIGYRRPPFAGPSGQPVPVSGGAFLEVVLRGARAHSADTGERTYTGPDEVRPTGLTAVRELQLVEDFEALLVWVIGLDRYRSFDVHQLDGPDRLVIDVGPPAPAPAVVPPG